MLKKGPSNNFKFFEKSLCKDGYHMLYGVHIDQGVLQQSRMYMLLFGISWKFKQNLFAKFGRSRLGFWIT